MSFNFSNITDELYIGTTPLAADYNGLRELGIRLVINMRLMHGPFPDEHHEPIKLLWLRTFDSPFFPIPIYKLMRGAKAALETIMPAARSMSIARADVTAAWRWDRVSSSHRATNLKPR